MDFRILGTVEVVHEDRSVDLGPPLEKAILARLLIEAGRILSLDRLIEDLWEGEPPASANVSIRVRISKLRKALSASGTGTEIRTQQPGYVLMLDPADSLDWSLFEALHNKGRTALQGGDIEASIRDLDAALSLWRGPALSGIGHPPFALGEIAKLEEARLAAVEDRIEAGIAAGRHAEHISELETLVAQNPLRERLWAQKMTALYRSGRQADALAAFQDLRRLLKEDLGIDPSVELSRLESQILEQAPEISLRVTASQQKTLPTGVVTFFLTDIEGSTEMWEANPSTMADVLEQHDGLIAKVIDEAGGHLIKSKGEGDATLSVFRRASDAVCAAVDLNRALGTKQWPDGVRPKVRLAIHTGEAHERDGDYFGPAVNRAARVRTLAHGGQVLLSQVAAELVRDSLPEGTSLADLGERPLRGLARHEHVFELIGGSPSSHDARAQETHPPSRPPLPVTLLPVADSLFVGRALELERLGTSLKEVTAGQLRAVFVAGEPGIGKTRLCSEFARLAYEQDAVVLYGRSDEEPLVPYQPFVEALRGWANALSPSERAGVPRAEYLAQLVTEFAGSARPAPAEDPEVARYKFFEAVASALEHATLAGPVLLILDDLHWADRPTLQLLQHVLRTRGSSAILVLGTYRESDLGRTRPLAEAMADFRRERAFERIALQGLAEEEILALLEKAATHDVGGGGRALARALSETTEGNPFFVEQILGNLIETGRLVLQEGQWALEDRVEDLGIPEAIIEAIGRRLSRLSEPCNKVLAAASVLGRDFEVDVLNRVVERDPDDVLAAVEEALQVGLVRESPGRGRATCTFSHALVQQALYGELSLARKQRLHLKAADAIEDVHKKDLERYVTSLARHLREAGAAADPDKAIDYSARAMEVAAGVFAFDEGIVHGEAALELMEDHGQPDQAMSARLHERLGDVHYVAGVEYGKSFQHYESALQAFEGLDEKYKVAKIHIKLGRGLATYPDVADIDKSLAHLHAAEEILGPSPDPRLAGPLSLGLSAASIWWADPESALAHARSAMQVGEAQGSESIWATAAAFEALALSMMGRFDESSRIHERAWEVADRLDSVQTAFAAAWTKCYPFPRDPREHVRLALLEVEKPRQAQTTKALEYLRLIIRGVLSAAGDMVEARGFVEGNWMAIDGGAGTFYFADSFVEEERRLIDQLTLLESQGLRWPRLNLGTRSLGPVQWALGANDRARTTFEQAIELCTKGCLTEECETRARLAILESYEGRKNEALAHMARCDEIVAQGQDWRGCLGTVAMARASCAMSEGRSSEAEKLFVEAADIFKKYGLPFGQAEALHLWGRALVDSDPERAVEKYDAALEIYVDRGIGKAWIDLVAADRDRASAR